MAVSIGKDTFIVCRNSQGAEVRATLHRLTRFLVVFEVYNPYSILQLSEVLSEFKIVMNDRLVYSGRAVVSNLVNTGIMLVCEAALEDSWLDVDLFSSASGKDKLKFEFSEFLKEEIKIHDIKPEYKVVIADMQTFLLDLRNWLEQVELSIRSEPGKDRLQMEKDVILELKKPIAPVVSSFFEKFEEAAALIPEEFHPVHRSYGKRQIHPIILCSPFVYRVFQKPLGYAGDYEMVNMILRDPFEGSSLFAKILNCHFLSQAPCEAHRNRVKYLHERLREETLRIVHQGKTAKIFNLGCGPAGEVQEFLIHDDLCNKTQLTLLDFNDETLSYTGKLLDNLKMLHGRTTKIQPMKKSVNQILKEAIKPAEGPPELYDLVYCAGLFDYLSDRICKRLLDHFYSFLAPGGLLIATNVDVSNPIKKGMECFLEWHLVYRDSKQLMQLKPDAALPEHCQIKCDPTGVNLFLEVRKPADGQ